MIGDNMRDIHFWVERDGKIIDPMFKEYEEIKKIRNLSDEIVYKPITDKKLIYKYVKEFHNGWDHLGRSHEIFEWASKGGLFPMFGECYWNSLNEIKKNGGKLKVGSMGWRIKNSKEVFYEYG